MDRIRKSEDPDAGVVDDRIAEAQERICSIQKAAAPSAAVEREAEDIEVRNPERQEGAE